MPTTVATSNPWYSDTTGAWTGTKNVRLMQWVDLNEDLTDGDMLSFTVNGVTLEVELQITADTINNAVVWQIGPFNPGIPWQGLDITVIDGGAVHIWID